MFLLNVWFFKAYMFVRKHGFRKNTVNTLNKSKKYFFKYIFIKC